AGAAYVPLDPGYPRARLAFMVEDAKLAVIVSSGPEGRDVAAVDTTVVVLDEMSEDLSRYSRSNPEIKVSPADLAYVIYTSGSTGRPKGVMVEHRNVVNFFAGMDSRIDHDPPGVWLAVTSISFDISVLELFWTLCRGFKVILPGSNIRHTGRSAPQFS